MASKANTPSIERVSVDKLIPYARNARTHSDAQVAQIAASMREFGFTNPVLIDADDGIIAGHGRVMAARKLKMADVPCIRLGHLNEAQRRLYVITDNKLALNAGWDMPMLSAEFLDLQGLDADLSLTGFSTEEIGALLAKAGTQGLTDPDAVPEAPETPTACVGDVWLLGRHRLVCGDCTDPLVVDKALAGVKPHLMVTDPPYGVSYDATWRNSLDKVKRSLGAVDNDDRADWRDAWALFPGDVAYVWHSGTKAHVVADSLTTSGFDIRSQIIWAKPHFAISRGHYHPQHEPCWYAVRGTGHWSGSRKEGTVWQIGNGTFQGGKTKAEDGKTGHSTQKPVECMKRPIENNSSAGQAVYEPFSGSGTTIIAGEMTGRTCHAIELNPAYIDVAVKRWEDFTGQKATREELKVAA
jgi:DNA modification methylase